MRVKPDMIQLNQIWFIITCICTGSLYR